MRHIEFPFILRSKHRADIRCLTRQRDELAERLRYLCESIHSELGWETVHPSDSNYFSNDYLIELAWNAIAMLDSLHQLIEEDKDEEVP